MQPILSWHRWQNHAVFALASAPLGGTNCGATGVTCQEAMFTTANGLT